MRRPRGKFTSELLLLAGAPASAAAPRIGLAAGGGNGAPPACSEVAHRAQDDDADGRGLDHFATHLTPPVQPQPSARPTW